jgi:carbon starvation protein CstA
MYIQKIWSELAKTCQKLVFLKITSFWPEFAISDQILCICILLYMYMYIMGLGKTTTVYFPTTPKTELDVAETVL